MTDKSLRELADRVEALKPKDVEGHIADAIQDKLRQHFGTYISSDHACIMSRGAIAAALRALGDDHDGQ